MPQKSLNIHCQLCNGEIRIQDNLKTTETQSRQIDPRDLGTRHLQETALEKLYPGTSGRLNSVDSETWLKQVPPHASSQKTYIQSLAIVLYSKLRGIGNSAMAPIRHALSLLHAGSRKFTDLVPALLNHNRLQAWHKDAYPVQSETNKIADIETVINQEAAFVIFPCGKCFAHLTCLEKGRKPLYLDQTLDIPFTYKSASRCRRRSRATSATFYTPEVFEIPNPVHGSRGGQHNANYGNPTGRPFFMPGEDVTVGYDQGDFSGFGVDLYHEPKTPKQGGYGTPTFQGVPPDPVDNPNYRSDVHSQRTGSRSQGLGLPHRYDTLSQEQGGEDSLTIRGDGTAEQHYTVPLDPNAAGQLYAVPLIGDPEADEHGLEPTPRRHYAVPLREGDDEYLDVSDKDSTDETDL